MSVEESARRAARGPLRNLLMAGHVPAGGSGGIVRYTLELAAALAHRPDDVRLHLGVNTGAVEYFRDTFPTAAIHPVQKRTGRLAILDEHLAGLAPFGRQIGATVDVVHSVKHIAPLFTRGARSVLTVHDMLVVDRPLDYSRGKRLLLKVPYVMSLTRADLLVCVSDATRQRLLSYYTELERRAVVVPLAASPRMLESAGEPVSTLEGRTFGVVVGDGLARKNLTFRGAAWHRLTRVRPELLLAVVGSGAAELPELSAEWRELLADSTAVALPRIRVLPQHGRRALPELYGGLRPAGGRGRRSRGPDRGVRGPRPLGRRASVRTTCGELLVVRDPRDAKVLRKVSGSALVRSEASTSTRERATWLRRCCCGRTPGTSRPWHRSALLPDRRSHRRAVALLISCGIAAPCGTGVRRLPGPLAHGIRVPSGEFDTPAQEIDFERFTRDNNAAVVGVACRAVAVRT